MHIGFVAHNFIRGNGQGRINFEIVRRALETGHAVTLLANRVSLELIELGARWVRVRSLPHRPNLIGGYTAAFNADRTLSSMRKELDVVVGAGFTLRSPHDVNLCQFVHGAWLRSSVHVARLSRGPWAWYQSAYTHFNARWEKEAYAAARHVVAPSEKIKAELISIGVAEHAIEVIYNGVDLDEFHPPADAAEKAAERKSLGLPSANVPLALFVGDIRTPRKNLDSVLKAIANIPKVHLAVVGELAQSPFPALAQSLGVADRVHFAGYSLEVKRYMRAADFFVFPSRYEAGTLVLMEAAATGLPLVTAKTAGGAEVFGSDAAATIDDPDDLQELIKAIKRFSSSPGERVDAGHAALAVAKANDWDCMADEYLRLFDSIKLKRPSSRVTVDVA